MTFVLVGAALAQRPGVGGHAEVVLQWLLGLRSLGCRVALVDRLVPEVDEAVQRAWLQQVLGPHDLPVLIVGQDRVPHADLLIDVMGYADVPAARRVFLDVDPGFGQLWAELGLHDPYDGYDAHVTVGTAVGTAASDVPTRGLPWSTTLPPVHLPRWPAVGPAGGTFTSVCTWRGPYGPVEHGGRTYGLRVHELRRLADLPRRSPVPLELALSIDPADATDREALLAGGWTLRDPGQVAGTPDAYRAYVRGSAGELCVAKNLYVDTRGGWFSDRSACYLASGRPVVAQDTGWTHALPTGPGLHAFTDAGGAVRALQEVAADPVAASRAARAVAEEHLDATVVLGRLLDRLGSERLAA